MKISAEAFSEAGDKYLGTPYSQMDCQAFVERCMRDCGLKMDLGGSNSWYREIMKHGWVGTPEECMKLFGKIPTGAMLFIWEPVSEHTPEKFRRDGIGDLTHMGIVTHRNDGAIHSSSKNKCVCTSKFRDKTIPNGGWNRIGLYDRFDYGKTVNWYMDHAGIGEKPQKKEETPMQAVTHADNGSPINFRAAKSTNATLIDTIPQGDVVETLGSEGTWTKIRWHGKVGYVMSKFLIADDSVIPAEDPDDFTPVDAADGQQGSDQVTLTFTVDELAAMLPILQKMSEQIITKVGRG